RQLGSGRWQARYPAVDGAPMTGPQTYATSKEARTHIAQVRADRSRSGYIDPTGGAVLLSDYAVAWIDSGGARGGLAKRTDELYRSILAKHIDRRSGARTSARSPPAWFAPGIPPWDGISRRRFRRP